MPTKTTSAKTPTPAKRPTPDALATTTVSKRSRKEPSSPIVVDDSAPEPALEVAPAKKTSVKKTKESNSGYQDSGPTSVKPRTRKVKAVSEGSTSLERLPADLSEDEGADSIENMDDAPDHGGIPLVEEDVAEFDTSLLTPVAGGGKSGRKPIIPPEVITAEMNLYEYLEKCSPPLDKKIIDIACSQSNVFGELRKDVSQEVKLVWSLYKPDTKRFKPGQIASYAHRIAGHAALRVRRDLGSAVRLPGSAFRERADGSSYVTPGVLAQALDWSDIENWMLLDGADSSVNGISSISLEVEGVLKHIEESGEVSSGTEVEDVSRNARLQHLEANKQSMTVRQYSILKSMIEGSRIDEIMEEHQIKKGLLLRELHIATELMSSVI